MTCNHDFYFWGDKLGDSTWFCYQCCGIVTWSELADAWILIEHQPDKKQYAGQAIQRIKDAWKQSNTNIPLPTMHYKHGRLLV